MKRKRTKGSKKIQQLTYQCTNGLKFDLSMFETAGNYYGEWLCQKCHHSANTQAHLTDTSQALRLLIAGIAKHRCNHRGK